MASIILVLLKYLIPLLSPVMADIKNKTVTVAIISSCSPFVASIFGNKKEIPPLICIAPNPKDVATPKIFANTTMKSTILPNDPFTLSPNRGS